MGIIHILKTVKYNDRTITVTDEMLKKEQHMLLEMMNDIVRVLDDEKIGWCLCGGCVIGAVRHKGFIPWDDDIDIFMTRKDFKRFQSIFENKLSAKYVLKVPGDKGYLMTMPVVQKKGTFIQSIQSVGNEANGLGIDIFLLENTYDNKIMRTIHGIRCTFMLFVDSAMRMNLCKDNILKFTENDPNVKKEVMKRARFAKLFAFRTVEQWLKTSDHVFSSVKGEGKYLVCPSGGKHFFGEIYDRKIFDHPKKMKFETEMWNVPNPSSAYLEIRYGANYMQIPKPEERERHVVVKFDLGGD